MKQGRQYTSNVTLRSVRATIVAKLIVAFRNFANAPKNDNCKIEIEFSKSVCACA